MLKNLLRGLAPVVALALAGGLAACNNNAHVSIDGDEGKPLSELDLTGEAPREVALLGPDTILISRGDKLAIVLEGEQANIDQMRFTLKGGTLGVLRKSSSSSASDGVVTVKVTMPDPRGLTMAGSGTIRAEGLAGDEARVRIAGSGTIDTPTVAADTLGVMIAGSGTYRGAGTAKKLDLSIAGSGDAALAGLTVDAAKVKIAGSGDSTFASDGKVDAKIMGSGEVKVIGRATCKVSTMGSGRLVCEPGPSGAEASAGAAAAAG
jgi:hypothetical protein